MTTATHRMSLFFLSLCVTLITTSAAGQGPETLILFDPSVPETPESIVFDRSDHAYISMATTGEIRRIGPDLTQSTVTFLPIGAPCFPGIALVLGLAMDQHDQLYAAVSACDPGNHGVWRIDTKDGSLDLVSNLPPDTVLNGIDVAGRWIYAADTFEGLVWRVPLDGGAPEIWADDPLLKIPPGSPFPGPAGIKYYHRGIHVSVTATGNIVCIPIEPDGSAGTAAVSATLPSPQGCDEFAFDVHGRIYCTTNPFNTLVRLDPDGTLEILLTAADLLDVPTSVSFGRRGRNRKNLYILNAAYPIFSSTFRPSLMRLRLDVPGAP